MGDTPTESEVYNVLREVIDPELGLNVVDLGLIYDVKVDKGNIHVKMTLTTPTCPLGGFILSQVESKLREHFGVEPEIELTFDPPWTPDKMSDAAKGALGYA